MIRQATITFAIAITMIASSSAAQGQVLSPPETTTSGELKTVKLEGVVSESKKYSFAVTTKDGTFTVKPTDNAVITLRLNKPYFDFQKRQVKVVKSVAALDARSRDEAPARAVFELPEEVYFVSRFEHASMFKRVMAKKIKRINNYLLTSENPGDIHPTESQLLMGGRLETGKSPNVVILKIGDKSYEAMFGHKRAFMTGFSVANLSPGETEVFVWGKVDVSGVVQSHRIEFQPIYEMELTAGQVSENASGK